MERLHADKHKLEDRLKSLEKAQLYEESSSGWVEEGGEGGEGKWEATLMLGEKTESDIGVSSHLLLLPVVSQLEQSVCRAIGQSVLCRKSRRVPYWRFHCNIGLHKCRVPVFNLSCRFHMYNLYMPTFCIIFQKTY